MWAKGESSVKDYAKELRGGIEWKRGDRQVELRLMRGLVGVHAKKEHSQFAGLLGDAISRTIIQDGWGLFGHAGILMGQGRRTR